MNGPTLVMGATGRTGRAIVGLLVGRGQPVRAAVRRVEDFEAVEGVTPVHFDLADPSTWSEALDGCSTVFLLWPPGTSTTDLGGFIDRAAERGVRRAAFLSVLGAERLSILPHHQVEKHLLGSGLRTVLLRSGYFMQNFSTVHRDDIRLRHELALPSGAGRISMVDLDDVAEAAVVGLLDRDDSVAWDLTGPEALNTGQVAERLFTVLGRPIRDQRPGIFRFYREQRARGVERGLVLFMIAEYTHARLGLAARLGEGVQEALGREPTSFLAFAERSRSCWT